MTDTAQMPSTRAFDYSLFTPDAADKLRSKAHSISALRQRQIEDIIQIGLDLIEVKESIEHGLFISWVSVEFAWDERTAQRFMGAARAFKDKSDTVSGLPPTILYALSAPSTPEPVRAEVIQKLETGEALAPADIKTMIDLGKKHQTEERRLAKLTPEAKKKEIQKTERATSRHVKAVESSKKEQASAKELGERAADRLAELLGPDLVGFVTMLQGADLYAFIEKLGCRAQGR